ncbi:pyrroloquinoline quinone biosynthesis protein PqqB [Cohnella lubricantis]|uniref:pyrroloquinoline quinone biosynthesis protein PqqB n=1 Tax=Cohnella lubricantis TaxID=2163172 RepID=UPI001AE34FE4|nr:pyrroloquinoline quinone biosynthesis protein PqqB [Cohnella lubricantis]MBP2117994.1 pyrroloquinoline quinone biosynthesis protein B [Cohnella lubricantis]
MQIRILGASAGGGLPQWNCACPNCRRARAGDPAVRPRTNDSLAVSADGRAWVLLNASPDISCQIEAAPQLQAGPDVRGSPIAGVLLTDAELDHTAGLLQLRQSAELSVWAPRPVLAALVRSFPVRSIVEPFASFRWEEARPRESFPLFEGRVKVCSFSLGSKPPRYADGTRSERLGGDWVVGYRLEDTATGGVAVYAPGVERWSEELERHAADTDCLLVDGTFWRSDELQTLGISDWSAADMGHLAVSGSGGTMEKLVRLPVRRKIYIHINNTNPMLDENSPERRQLDALGIEVGYDGMELEV